MKILIVSITVLSLFVLPQQSLALMKPLYMNGTDLQRFSEADEKIVSGKIDMENAADASQFMGYVIGIVDASILLGALCPPQNATKGQLMAIVSKYIKNNPEKWNKAGADLVLDALTPVFPCKVK